MKFVLHLMYKPESSLSIIIYISMLLFLVLIFAMLPAAQCKGLPSGFAYLSDIDPTIIIQPRYAIPANFVGEVIDGYLRKTVIITLNAGYALANIQNDLRKLGYSLVVYDAYRPQKAVDHFVRWSKQPEDYKTKAEFYPYLDKERIIPDGYVAEKSGHSRGSTVDLTIIPLGKSIHQVQIYNYNLTDGTTILYRDDGSEFMGSHFDFFGLASHHDSTLIPNDLLQKRNLLRSVMQNRGFRPLKEEWWHYTLIAEPFPDTYFDFDII